MSHTIAQLQALVDRCEQFRGAKAPAGYPDGLALCVIDSVQSTGVKYASVGKVIDRYRAYRLGQGDEPNSDGVRLADHLRQARRPGQLGAKDRYS